MKQSPELKAMLVEETTDEIDKNDKCNRVAGGAALLIGGVIMAYFILAGMNKSQQTPLKVDEAFNTTSFRPPSFNRQKPEPEKEVEKEPPPAPPVVVSLPPPPKITKEPLPKRFMSGLLKLDSSNANATAQKDGEAPLVAGTDRNSAFLANAAKIDRSTVKATRVARIDAVVAEGTLIPGILETAIISDLPGQIRGITSQDVYSMDGRRVLIPMGTRLIGEYQSEVVEGQTRVFVIWTRLIRDDGVSMRLNSYGADSLGRSGLTGDVDRKWLERYGPAALLSVIGAGVSYASGVGSDQINYGDDPVNGMALAREALTETFSKMAEKSLGKTLGIPPTISVDQGTRIFIFVRQDLDFSALYDDPVTEAMKEIQRERRRR